jgi:hypothetical protein
VLTHSYPAKSHPQTREEQLGVSTVPVGGPMLRFRLTPATIRLSQTGPLVRFEERLANPYLEAPRTSRGSIAVKALPWRLNPAVRDVMDLLRVRYSFLVPPSDGLGVCLACISAHSEA